MSRSSAFAGLIAGIAGLSAGVFACQDEAHLESRRWCVEPLVVVCPDSPVSPVQVQRALGQWSRAGAPALQVIARPSDCGPGPHPGQLYIQAGRDGFGPEGEVEIVTRGICVQEGSLRLPLDSNLEHEVGHIWFEQHGDDPTHVMHFPPGPSFDGVLEAFDEQ